MRPSLITLSAAATVAALPNITVVPKENRCSNWPFFRQYESVAGPFAIFADSTGKDIDGNKASYQTTKEVTIASAWLSIANQKDVAVPRIQCQVFGSAEMLAMSVDSQYQPLSISEYIYHEYDGLIFIKSVAKGAPIEPHWHYYPNGTRQAGTFLGWNNFTTWAYLLDETSGQYRVRLLTDSQTLYDGEFTGFVRAGDPSTSD
ncbi:uncharacterized protein F4822DRAFT_234993 [Hypoxylon trugodes]|uniref:uncharacterized protein n=1 Tax=Hypoxylon trugodes TaxID=326681 RepID=UPI002197C7EE|nr:uncharacterized protein F4822DRAFT_234993 [Hypoxylon trugodes]KAI1390388.1 hypothetical protein F4822DRAFT_234993 [Hypoxylon trugodes]